MSRRLKSGSFTMNQIDTLQSVFKCKALYDMVTRHMLPLHRIERSIESNLEPIDRQYAEQKIHDEPRIKRPDILMDNLKIMENKIIQALIGTYAEHECIPSNASDSYRPVDFWVVPDISQVPKKNNKDIVIDEDYYYNYRHDTRPPKQIIVTSKIFKDSPVTAFIVFRIPFFKERFSEFGVAKIISRCAKHMTAWCTNLLKPLIDHYKQSRRKDSMMLIDSIEWILLNVERPEFDIEG